MKRHIHPLNNPNCTLWEAICDMENLKLAHQNAKKGKGWYAEVKMVDLNTTDMAQATKIIAGTAKQMGIEVIE